MSGPDPEYWGWLIASLRSGLLAVDAEGRVVALNELAAGILGCAPAAGGDCREVLAGQPTVARVLLEALEGRERPSRAELLLEAGAGRPARTIGFTVLSVRDDGDELRGAAMIFRDLTPYERMDEQERLRERLAALGQMAAGLAHEIRNPLASMEVLAGLLKRELGDRPAELQLLEDLTADLRGLAATVTASLDFVKPVSLSHGRVDPIALVEQALAQAQARVPFRGVVERDYPKEVPELVADPEQLRTVVANLVLNALEAMAESRADAGEPRLALSLRVSDPDGELVIGVADSGPGVPEELRERVFYPFFTTRERGSGVGLANAQKIVASHGGLLELAAPESTTGAGGPSEPVGRGARFLIHLPLREPRGEDPPGS